MPKPTKEIVAELNDLLRKSGNPVITIPWPDFYELCDMERFKEPRADQIKEEAESKFNLGVAYFGNIVLVCHDRNFDPVL